jgi:hypothetical protein
VHSSEYRGVAHGAIVDRHTVDDGDREEQAASLDLLEHGLVSGFGGTARDIVIEDLRVVAVAPLDFSADYGRDLLRRPGRTSTSRETVGRSGDIVYLNDYGVTHSGLHSSSDPTGAAGTDAYANTAPGALVLCNSVAVGAGVQATRDWEDCALGAHPARRAAGRAVARRVVYLNGTHR